MSVFLSVRFLKYINSGNSTHQIAEIMRVKNNQHKSFNTFGKIIYRDSKIFEGTYVPLHKNQC